MSRTRVRRRRVVLVVTIAVAGGLWAGPWTHGAPDLRPVASHRYVVRQGDTLWAIAGRLGAGGDPRPLVDAIASTNHVDPASIRPGQTLIVPAA